MVSEGASAAGPAGSKPAVVGMESGSESERAIARRCEHDGGASADAAGAPPDADVSASAEPGASGEPREEQSPTINAPAPPLGPQATESSLWPDRLLAVAVPFYEWLSRPRVRLTVTGVILLMIGGLFMTSSVWTLPLVLAGALMVVVAWIGRRLDGRFAVQWGETGTQLEFRARIMAPPPVPVHPVRPAVPPTSSSSQEPLRRPEPEPEHADTIDGEAHTIEIDVAELEALIAAAETSSGEIAQADASVRAARDLRVADGRARPSEAGR